MDVFTEVRLVLGEVFEVENQAMLLPDTTPLLGGAWNLDSLAVLRVIVALEDRFGFTIEGGELTEAVFETLGSLAAFVEKKHAAQ
jgi:acyl carrier protein